MEKGRLVWALARQGAFQLPAPMAETGLDIWFRKRTRLESWMVGQSICLCTVPMASEMVVGLPKRLRIPQLWIPLRISSVLS